MQSLRRLHLAALALLGACGGGATGARVTAPTPVASTSASSGDVAVVKEPPHPPFVPATPIGAYGEGTFGPRVVRAGKRAIVISAPRSTSGRRWMAQGLDESDRPRADARHELAEAPEDTTTWDVTAVGDGFVLSWTRPTDAGEQLLALPLGPDGEASGAPIAIARSGEDLVAVRIVPLGKGDAATPAALLTFGEKTTPKGALSAAGTLYAMPLDSTGHPLAAAPTQLASHLSGWQVTALGTSAIVAFVERSNKAFSGAPEEAPRTAKVATLTFGSKGAIKISDAATLTKDETSSPEIDVVATSATAALVVWADRRELDVHLFSAVIDASSGKPKLASTPTRAVRPRGDESLVALVSTKSGPLLFWETYAPRPTHEPRRRFDLVRLGKDGTATGTPRSIWYPYSEDEPEITVAGESGVGDDVAILTYGERCLDAGGGAQLKCDPRDLRPWIVRFSGPMLDPVQADLIDVGDVVGGTAGHAFDVACTSAQCTALVDGPGDPSTVAIAHVATRAAVPPPPVWVYAEMNDPAASPPRLEGATTMARESQFAGLHAARTMVGTGVGTLVAWVTYSPDDVEEAADDEPKSKKKKSAVSKDGKDGGGARVAVRLLDASGEPASPIAIVSERALSKGDVAVAAADNAKDGGVVAYVSRAEGDEEVYVGRVDSSGKKSGGSSRITHADGSASDVALAALPEGGYLLTWVDGRNDVLSVYAARLDKSGGKLGSEVKIGGGSAGDVADLSMTINGSGSAGSRVLVAWSDSRDDLTTGFGDVYFTVVSGKDPSKALVSERALIKTKLHSHNPVVSSRGDGGALLAWMEDDPQATELLELTGKSDWGAFVARIDASGAVVQPAAQVEIDPSLGSGVVTGVAADCSTFGAASSSLCRIALAWGDREGIALLGASIGNGTLGPARSVWSYVGAPTQEVAPALVGGAVFLCEDGLEPDDGRVRRLSIAW